jgi:hypothetical protein
VVASPTLAFVMLLLLLPIRSHKRFFPAAETSVNSHRGHRELREVVNYLCAICALCG